MTNGVSKSIKTVVFEHPVTVFLSDSLELNIKRNTAMVVNAAGRVRETIKFKIEDKEETNNGQETSTRS